MLKTQEVKINLDVEKLCDITELYILPLLNNIDNPELSEKFESFYSDLANLHPLNHINGDVEEQELYAVADIVVKS